jgi:hypothetical protein
MYPRGPPRSAVGLARARRRRPESPPTPPSQQRSKQEQREQCASRCPARTPHGNLRHSSGRRRAPYAALPHLALRHREYGHRAPPRSWRRHQPPVARQASVGAAAIALPHAQGEARAGKPACRRYATPTAVAPTTGAGRSLPRCTRSLPRAPFGCFSPRSLACVATRSTRSPRCSRATAWTRLCSKTRFAAAWATWERSVKPSEKPAFWIREAGTVGEFRGRGAVLLGSDRQSVRHFISTPWCAFPPDRNDRERRSCPGGARAMKCAVRTGRWARPETAIRTLARFFRRRAGTRRRLDRPRCAGCPPWPPGCIRR